MIRGLHVLTPFHSPSLLRKEGVFVDNQQLKSPLCGAERGFRGEYVDLKAVQYIVTPF